MGKPLSDAVGDEILARMLKENDDVEARLEHFRMLGKCIGSVYTGLTSEGVPNDHAFDLSESWMECHIFSRIQLLSGGHEIAPDDEPDEDEGEPA